MDDSLPRLRWTTAEADVGLSESLARDLGLPRAIGMVLVSRGLCARRDAEAFLNPRLSSLSDPFLLPGVSRAVERICAALEQGEPIVVFGDYDVDGVSGTAMLVQILKAMGGKVKPFLPTRAQDGYGFTVPPLRRCLERRCPKLIITVDCGTNDHEAVEEAARAGVDVIVTDHHEGGARLAPALALVNPKLSDRDDLKVLAGVGVVFKLCHALIKRWREQNKPEARGLDLRAWLDLVAVGTVADVAALTGENRILVRHGLARLNEHPRPGLNALMTAAGVYGSVNGYHLGFVLGPRLNAAGRLDTADTALDLLLAIDPRKTRELASRLDSLNRERKRVEDDIFEAAADRIGTRAKPVPGGIVVGDEGWHVGTIGIVASRLCGVYRVPAAVVSFNGNGEGRGSCRSTEAVNILAVLEQCAEFLETFGGHHAAAGFSIERSRFEAFQQKFDHVCRQRLGDSDLTPHQCVDAWITLGEADYALFEAIEKLRPLGLGNPTPVWGVRGVRLVGPAREVGKKMEHLKMLLGGGGSQMDAIAFNMAGVRVPEGELDVLFHLQENTYLGRRSLQLNIKDLRASRPEPPAR